MVYKLQKRDVLQIILSFIVSTGMHTKFFFQQIRARVQLNDPNVPENIDISWRVLCPGETEWMDNSLLCNNVTLENEVKQMPNIFF